MAQWENAPPVDVAPAWAAAPEVDKPDASPPAQQRGLGGEIARQLGLTMRAPFTGAGNLAEMALTPVRSVANMGNALIERLTGIPQARYQNTNAIPRALDVVFPRPENAGERIAQDVAGALATSGGIGALTGAPVQMAGRTMTAAAPTSEVGAGIASQLSSNMGTQLASTAAGTGAAGLTRESGGGPLAQLSAGLAAGVGVPMAGSLLANAGSPQRALNASVAKSEETAFGREGQRLAQATGVEMTPGARTGNRFMTAMENTARQYAKTADQVQDIDVKIANQAINRVEQIAGRIGTAQNPEALGNNIRATIQRAAQALDDARTSQAAKDYGLVREIAGDGKVIRLSGFADELKSIIDDYANVAGADAQKVVSQAQAALRRITGELEPGVPTRDIVTPAGGRIRLYGEKPVVGTLDNTISEAIRTRSFYGKAAKGSANVFEDIAPNLQRSLASRLFGAINRDFDVAAEAAGGPLKQALADANANFRKMSQSIEFLEGSALGKMIGDDLVDAALSGRTVNTTAGEAIVAKINNMHPSVRGESLDIINRYNPALANNVRSNFLREAVAQGQALPPSVRGSGQVPISFNRFLNALGSEKVGFDANLRSYGFKPDEIKDIKEIAQVMLRQGDRTGTNFSNSTVMKENLDVVEGIGTAAMATATGGFSGAIKSGGALALRMIARQKGMEKIAELMANPEGRKALMTIKDPQASRQALLQAFAVVDEQTKGGQQ